MGVHRQGLVEAPQVQQRDDDIGLDGIDVVGPTDHTIFKSIYFFDPSGHRLELAANTGTPAMAKRLLPAVTRSRTVRFVIYVDGDDGLAYVETYDAGGTLIDSASISPFAITLARSSAGQARRSAVISPPSSIWSAAMSSRVSARRTSPSATSARRSSAAGSALS